MTDKGRRNMLTTVVTATVLALVFSRCDVVSAGAKRHGRHQGD